MLITIKGNLNVEKPKVVIIHEANWKRKTTSASKRGKGKNKVKETLSRKDNDEKETCFHCDMKGH